MADEPAIDEVIRALARVTYPPGSAHKRFARDMAERVAAVRDVSTPRQRAHVERLAWRYRRQMPARLVPPGNPDRIGDTK